MLSEKMQTALNHQINAELHSAYVYLAMSAYFEHENLPGFANWMRVQAQEEVGHAMRIYGFVVERLGRVTLSAIGDVPNDWPSPLDVFKNAFEHEKKISGMINDLVDLSLAERDHAANAFLQWFVNEQVEEESSADAIVQQLSMIGDSGAALFLLDRELGARQAGEDEDET